MQTLDFLIPGDPATATGGYVYDRRIAEGLRAIGWTVRAHALDASFPHPSAAAIEQAREVLAGLAEDSLVLIDGLALGAMPELVTAEADRLRQVALIHHPLAAETGLSFERARALHEGEQRALAAVARIVVTSEQTKQVLGRARLIGKRVGIVEPGTDPAPVARGSGSGTLNLLCVATLTPRKGHAVLLDALARLRDRDWQLVCAGSADRSPETAEALHRQIADLGLNERVLVAGELDDPALQRLYDDADLFVLPTWLEGYGMAVAEAIARGLPVVSTATGAIPEMVGDAGMLVAPGDVGALANALALLMDDPGRRHHLADVALTVRARLTTWEQATARMATELEAAARA